MAKIHINSNGEPGECKATSGPCPFGDDDTHFSSTEEAAEAYSKAHEVMGNASFGKTSGKMGENYAEVETQKEAEKLANLITNEGKYAAIVSITEHQYGGEPDARKYEDDDDYSEDLERWRESALDGEAVEEERYRGYQVRAFESFEDAKAMPPSTWNTNWEEDAPTELEDNVDEVTEAPEFVDVSNLFIVRKTIEFRKPKK